eukprot:g8670.t1
MKQKQQNAAKKWQANREAVSSFFGKLNEKLPPPKNQSQKNQFEILGEFVNTMAPKALALTFHESKGDAIFIRFEIDGTSRETRNMERSVENSAKWIVITVSAWVVVSSTSDPTKWPKWKEIPASSRFVEARINDDADCLPAERAAQILADEILQYLTEIEKLAPEAVVCTVLCGDAAETGCLLDTLAILMEHVPDRCKSMRWYPDYQRCAAHQGSIVGEDSIKVFCQLAGEVKKTTEKKLYVQAAQCRKEREKMTRILDKTMPEALWVDAAAEESEDARNFTSFLETMRVPIGVVDALQGCYPIATDFGVTPDGIPTSKFYLKAPSHERKEAVMKAWKRLYGHIELPRHNRWLTYGEGARTVAVMEALSHVSMVFRHTQKPWHIEQPDWDLLEHGVRNGHERNSICKMLMGIISMGADGVMYTVLKTKLKRETIDELDRIVLGRYSVVIELVRDRGEIMVFMHFVTCGGTGVPENEKEKLRVAAFHAVQAGACIVHWRIGSGARDEHSIWLLRYRAGDTAMQVRDPCPELAAGDMPTPAQKAALERAGRKQILQGVRDEVQLQDKKGNKKPEKLLNEPGSLCLKQWKNNIRSAETVWQAMFEVDLLAAGRVLSDWTQASCERKICSIKRAQQENRNQHKGMVRLSSDESRLKFQRGHQQAQIFWDYGEEEDDDEEGHAQASRSRAHKPQLTEQEKADMKLETLKIAPRWQNVITAGTQLRFGVKLGDQFSAYQISAAMQEAKVARARRGELLDQQATKATEAAQRARAKFADRKDRATTQLSFWKKLKELVSAEHGKDNTNPNPIPKRHRWNRRNKLEAIRKKLMTKVWPKFQMSAVLRTYRVRPCGLERFLAWIATARLGTEPFTKYVSARFADLPARMEEEQDLDNVRQNQAQNLGTEVADVFNANPTAAIVLRIPVPIPGFDADGDFFILVYFVERGPFSFVGCRCQPHHAAASRLEATSSSSTSAPVFLPITPTAFDVASVFEPSAMFISQLMREELRILDKTKITVILVDLVGERGCETLWHGEALIPPSADSSKAKDVNENLVPRNEESDSEMSGSSESESDSEQKLIEFAQAVQAQYEADQHAAEGKRLILNAEGQLVAPAAKPKGHTFVRPAYWNAGLKQAEQRKKKAVAAAKKQTKAPAPSGEANSAPPGAGESAVGGDGDDEDDRENFNIGVPPVGGASYLGVDVASSAERLAQLRECRRNFGNYDVEGFDVDIMSVNKVMVRAVFPRYVRMWRLMCRDGDLQKMLVTEGGNTERPVRAFAFDLSVETNDEAKKLAFLWATRAKALFDYARGRLGATRVPNDQPTKGSSLVDWLQDEIAEAAQFVKDKNDNSSTWGGHNPKNRKKQADAMIEFKIPHVVKLITWKQSIMSRENPLLGAETEPKRRGPKRAKASAKEAEPTAEAKTNSKTNATADVHGAPPSSSTNMKRGPPKMKNAAADRPDALDLDMEDDLLA